MTSDAKTAANRQNALKSTGPRTKDGKSRSRLNGVKHGIHATAPVLPGEDRRAYEELAQAYLDHFAPVGPLEKLLVRQITAEEWRLQRFDRAEVALASQIQGAKAIELFEHLDKKSTRYAYSLLYRNGNHGPSPVAANYIATEIIVLNNVGRVKEEVADLSTADKKFIKKKVADVQDIGSTILESLTSARQCAPQEHLDRQRRTAMRALISYVAELKELQEARLTLNLTPGSSPEIDAAPTTGGRRLKLVSAGERAEQIDQASQNKTIEDGGS